MAYSYIGSYALQRHISGYREPKDLDILTDDPTLNATKFNYGGKIEIHRTEGYEGFRPLLAELYPDPALLLTLKMSHLAWDHNNQFVKHAKDIILLQQNGYEPDRTIYFSLRKFWEKRFGQKKAYLKKSNEEFFEDNVDRYYSHDSLHQSVAYHERPLYERLKDDLDSAYCSESRFKLLSPEDKRKLAREEIYATALERFLIPNNFKRDATAAYRMALRQLITSMTKGFFCNYLIFNLALLINPDRDYVNLFHKGIKNGTVQEI